MAGWLDDVNHSVVAGCYRPTRPGFSTRFSSVRLHGCCIATTIRPKQLNYTHHLSEYTALDCSFDVAQIKQGWNETSICCGGLERETPGNWHDNVITSRHIEPAVMCETAAVV